MTLPDRIASLSEPLEPQPTYEKPRLQTLTGISAVAFDIYGTLIISGSGDIGLVKDSAREEAMKAAFQAVGVKPKRRDLAKRFHELIRNDRESCQAAGVEHPEVEIRDIWRTLCAEADVNADIEALAIEFECRTNPVWPMPHLEPVLRELHERGLALGIVSNAQFYTPHMFPAFLGKSLEELGFEPSRQIYSFTLREGKPSTLLYHRLAEKLEPDETLYVGNDMLKDVWPAQKAGFKTALFAGDKRSLRKREDDPRVRGVEPDLVITDLAQIPGTLQ